MGKSVYVYGADSEPGRMIVRYLLKRGETVTVQVSSLERAAAMVDDLPEPFGARFHPAVVAVESATGTGIDQQLKTTHEKRGLDVYIHVAAWHDEASLLEEDSEQFANHIKRCLGELFWSCRSAGQLMARLKKGQIMIPLLSDVLHYDGFPASPVYNQAAIAFMKSLAKELTPFRISVNALEFGYYRRKENPGGSASERRRFDLYALKPPIPDLEEIMHGIGMLLDYGTGLTGQTISWGYGLPYTTN